MPWFAYFAENFNFCKKSKPKWLYISAIFFDLQHFHEFFFFWLVAFSRVFYLRNATFSRVFHLRNATFSRVFLFLVCGFFTSFSMLWQSIKKLLKMLQVKKNLWKRCVAKNPYTCLNWARFFFNCCKEICIMYLQLIAIKSWLCT